MSTSRKARHLAFDVQTAIDYGVNEAIIIQNLIRLIEEDFSGENHHNGRTWIHSTQESFTRLFPFWSKEQIQRIMESLEKKDVLIKGIHSKTLSYTFKNDSLWLNIDAMRGA